MSPEATLVHRVDQGLRLDRRRVVARLFLPGEEISSGRSRVSDVVGRVLDLDEDEVALRAEELVENFSARHRDFVGTLVRHAAIVSSHIEDASGLSSARTLLLGASFTAGYAVEGAALCNPSAVLHPDQSGLEEGQARVAVSLRGIGEGHVSSVGFAGAVVGPGATWVFEPRRLPAVAGTVQDAPRSRESLRAVLTEGDRVDDLAHTVLARLPEMFTGADLHEALTDIHPDLLAHPGAQETVGLMGEIVASMYEVAFPSDVHFSQQVLVPYTPEESNGMEDARFTRFTDVDGSVDYRATYTAYDGNRIAPRLLTTSDMRTFSAQRLAGPAARNKGMALFPRLVGGLHWALCRSDGESNGVATSVDGVVWGEPQLIEGPVESWEVLQVGNCGPPIETDRGWLVLTHGVGPMRTYAIGAILLDLEDPTVVIARLRRPLLQTAVDERDGYVPNVVYSCGGVVLDGRLWLPYGIGDARVRVAWVDVEDLLVRMEHDSATDLDALPVHVSTTSTEGSLS